MADVQTCGIFLYSVPRSAILICHPTHGRWNQWSIPKGIREEGEDLWQVAVRELEEETGINLSTVNVMAAHPLPKQQYLKQKKSLDSFLVITNENFDNYTFRSNLVEGKDFPEVDRWKWVALNEASQWIHETQAACVGSIAAMVASGNY